MLGFIMLAGLIVNNGIVLIDYINQARREGMSKHEAIIDAGRTRLRPILMTAMTTILAMFTSAIGIGDGSDMIKADGNRNNRRSRIRNHPYAYSNSMYL